MLNNDVWIPVLREDHPDERPITTTWAMKLKSNGTKRPRCNARGFEQEPDVHYDPESKAAPVANLTSIRVMLTLWIACLMWKSRVLDVKGAFLKGKFVEGDKPMALEVPQGFIWVYTELGEEMKAMKDLGRSMTQEEVKARLRELFEKWKAKPIHERIRLLRNQRNPRGGVKRIILRLLTTLYGTVQAARAFWRELLQAFKTMSYSRADADPCIYFRWNQKNRLAIWLSWIDDCLIIGDEAMVDQDCERMKELFDCDDVGMAKEYVGAKFDQGEDYIILTQPVLLQSFEDEFGVKAGDADSLPAKPGQVLKNNDGELLDEKSATKYRKGVGKLVYLARWTRPDVLNSVRELARQNKAPTEVHFEAMLKCMKYCISTPDLGLKLKTNRLWNGSRDHEFDIAGHSDSIYAQCTETRKSVSGNTTTLDGSPVVTRSAMQTTVKLSVTEAELESAVTNVQDMLHVKNIIESIGLKVKLPMLLHVDNQGVREIVNNWSVGGRTRHVATKQMFLRELKEEGILRVVYEKTEDMPSDIFTKNAPGPIFRKHREFFMGSVKELCNKAKKLFGLEKSEASARESVGGCKTTVGETAQEEAGKDSNMGALPSRMTFSNPQHEKPATTTRKKQSASPNACQGNKKKTTPTKSDGQDERYSNQDVKG